MRFLGVPNTAAVNRLPLILAVPLLGVLCFLQSPGLTVADTKHDLVADPWHFLKHAFDVFPVQNQAYGYVFPQGLFFALADPLPDWVAQRLWWWLVLSVGYVGFFRLTGSSVASVAYVLSPHTVATLGAISSETWPMMVAPWVLLGFIRRGDGWAVPLWGSVVAAGCLGAVNAAASVAALVPAALVAVWGVVRGWVPWRRVVLWGGGVVLVSLWWLVPLFRFAKVAPPFMDYIESASVTTAPMSVLNVLRGATSWVPFVSWERAAAHEMAVQSEWVFITTAVAVVGLIGLVRVRSPWLLMLVVGVVLLVGSRFVPSVLDGPLVAFRNVHKFDLLVRIPLCIGVGIGLSSSVRSAVRSGVLLLVVLAVSPAWTGRLAPLGAYERVPGYYQEAADYINANAVGTTLITPAAQFARQDWGWTRDDPFQPLLRVPWVLRDAIPIVESEDIRQLDGVMAVLGDESVEPVDAVRALRALGFGMVVVRHDLDMSAVAQPSLWVADSDSLSRRLVRAGVPVKHFGRVDVAVLGDPVDLPVCSMRGAGEAVALVAALYGQRCVPGVSGEVVTDTPALVGRDFGDLGRPSEFLTGGSPRDYASVADPVPAVVRGEVRASQPGYTAAIDGDVESAWAPVGPAWIELRNPAPVIAPWVEFVASGRGVVWFESDAGRVSRFVTDGERVRVRVPGPSDRVRVGVDGVGVADVRFADVNRSVRVDVPVQTRAVLLQRVMVPEASLERTLVIHAPMRVRVTSDVGSWVEDVQPGEWRISSRAHWMLLEVSTSM